MRVTRNLGSVLLNVVEIAEYADIINHSVNAGMTYAGLHRRLLRLERRRAKIKDHKRLCNNHSAKKGYSLEIRAIVQEMLAIRNLQERVEERISLDCEVTKE